MKINWLFLLELYGLTTAITLATTVLNFPSIIIIVLCFGLGLVSTRLFTWLHGRPMALFTLNDKQD